MTRETAINLLDNLIGMVEDNQQNDYDEAFKLAIRSLKAWDKIFDELYENIGTTNTLYSKEWNDAFDTGCQFALIKINKHLKEVEDEN